MADPHDKSEDGNYVVVARRYRPRGFGELVGQEHVCRALVNAIETNRVGHAYLFTGARGVGKTSAARIFAKALNNESGPSATPDNESDVALAIDAGQDVDVIEIDGASNRGIDEIRSLRANIGVRPSRARYKIYIIDEVHMLSNSAFNALLKTLEEPPAHVKFIFATTEIRKVPVTVLSRCQRFDLRRIEPDVMIAMLQRIAKVEGAGITEEALRLITRAAEGSARDAQSLLDQAISHGAGQTTADQVRAMLGLADRGRVLDLFDLILRGDAEDALGELSAQYAAGADPMAILRDLAEVSHWVSVIKITPVAAEDPTVSPDERNRGLVMAERLPMRVLSRMWQMLLTALEEVGRAPNAMMAAEMALIRLTHVADLPTPDELIRKLQNTPIPAAQSQNAGTPDATGARAHQSAQTAAPQRVSPSAYARDAAPRAQGVSGATASAAHAKAPSAETLAGFARFEDVLELIRHHRDVKLLVDVETSLKLVSYSPGRIEFEPTDTAPRDLAQRLGTRLQTWTAQRWAVSIGTNGASTIATLRDEAALELKEQAKAHPLVQAVLVAFPKAQISEIRTAKDIAAEAQIDALPEVEDEWDPFDDE